MNEPPLNNENYRLIPVDLLRRIHEMMDDMALSMEVKGCRWCVSRGYDANGLIHKEDCVLILLRQELT